MESYLFFFLILNGVHFVCVCVCWDSCLFCLCVQQPRIQSNDTVFSVFLQVYIRILDNEWNVYRRYTEFRELHNHLRTPFPQVDTFSFPPKKAIGNKVGTCEEKRSLFLFFPVFRICLFLCQRDGISHCTLSGLSALSSSFPVWGLWTGLCIQQRFALACVVFFWWGGGTHLE